MNYKQALLQSFPGDQEMIQENPSLLSFVPLMYVAWADAVLTPTEVDTLKSKINAQKWLKKDEKAMLRRWMDPANPPQEKQIKAWLHLLREAETKISKKSKMSLVELGTEVARFGSPQKDLLEEECKALEDLQDALGVVGEEACRNILYDHRPRVHKVQKKTKASFAVAAMKKLLDKDAPVIKNKLRLIMSDPVFTYVKTYPKETYRKQVMEWCYRLARQGLGSIAFPKKYGGKADMGRYISTFEMLGYHDLSLAIKFGVQFGLFGGSVHQLGTQRHHERYLKDIGTLDIPGCFGMTESGHGSNVRDIQTTATYHAKTQEFIIHTPNEQARKDYIGNAAQYAQLATVFAQLITNGENYGVHAFIVPIRNKQGKTLPRITISDCGDKLGLNGVDNGRLIFDQVRIPRENLLNRFGDVDEHGDYHSSIKNDSHRFFTMLGTLVGGRMALPKAGISASKTALAIAVKYACQRRQFGPAGQSETLLMDYISHQKRLMPLLSKCYALDFALKYVVNRYQGRSEDDSQEVEGLAAGLKAYSTWATTDIIQTCREACGGVGYLAENRFADLKADTDIFTTFEGDNTVLMQLVAKGRLGEFKKSFHDINFFGLLKYLTKQGAIKIKQLNPVVVRMTSDDHLQDPEFQLNAFLYREQKLLVSAASRIKHRIDQGIDSYQAFIECQDHLIRLGTAFIERVIVEQFHKVVDQERNKSLKNVLKTLCDLYTLSTMEKNRGWYLEQDYIAGSKSKAIRKLVISLCGEVRKDALPLIESFAIPENCLAAPMLKTEI